MNDQLEVLRKRIMDLFSDDQTHYEVHDLIKAIDDMENTCNVNVSDEAVITADTLKKAYTWLTQGNDWNHIIQGSHPELEKLVSILDESSSTQEEIFPQSDVLSKSPVNSESCLTKNTGRQKNSEIDKTKDCSKTFPEEKQMLDFHADDDCNDIVPPSQEEIEKCLHTAKECVLLNEGIESSGDETQDPTEHNRSPQRRNVEDLLQDSRQTLRNLAEANIKLKKIVKDPYQPYNSNDELEKNDEPSRSEKRKKFLAPQEDAKQVAWDESGSDSSLDVDEPVVKKGVAVKKKVKHRAPWSQDEMDFIRDGVRMFGIGDWAGIRDHYPFKTEHRNSVKIKDKYRHMVKHGLIVVASESESNS